MREVGIALDLFGLVILLIIFFSCLLERIKQETKSSRFLMVLASLIVLLGADALYWFGSGHPELRMLTLIASTLVDCVGYIALVFFLMYLMEHLLMKKRLAAVLVGLLLSLCGLFVAISVANVFYGFQYTLGADGVLVWGQYPWIPRIFSWIVLVVSVLIILFMVNRSVKNRLLYLLYLLFPLAGTVVDDLLGVALMIHIGAMISVILMYTNIYLQKRRTIADQRNALMISQINPHFMYNTLTTVASLCDTDPSEAKDLIIEFSTFLRQNLNTLTANQMIPFEQELRHVDCYLKIEKARFKERVQVVYALQTKNFSLPALCVQPMVENAVKHGLSKKIDGGTVKIATYTDEKHYIVEILDDGVGFDSEKPGGYDNTHVGISNVRSRLKDMCGGTLTVKSMPGVGTRVTMKIPRRKGGTV